MRVFFASAALIAVAATALRAQARDVAITPESKRLHELVAAVNTGDAEAVRSYLEANSLDLRTGQGWSSTLLPLVLELQRTSRGLDVVRVTTIGAQSFQPQHEGRSVGILHNKATGDEQALAIIVEPQAPHRITGLPVLHPGLIASLVRPAVSAARTEAEQLAEIGAYLKRLADADIFSGVVIIARDGKPVLSQAYGFADRERKIPNTLSTPFMLGSMNKLFTSLAIGQLVEQGKLSYDDPLSKFVPDFPDAESAQRIQLKHLLSHTSGLGDYSTSKAYKAELDRMTSVQALLDAAGREPLKFEPGTKWAYSNTGFVVLGRIIEVVTGGDYYDHMMQNVFAPAGMTAASFPVYPRDGVAAVPMALPYEVEFDGERQRYVNKLGFDFRRASPSGVGLASALDLIALSNAIKAGRVVKPETYRLHSSAKPELGALNYGYGFSVGARQARRPLVGHGGNAYGQCTEFGELRDTPYTIVVLSNLTIGTCMSVTGRILRELSPSGTTTNTRAAQSSSSPEKKLDLVFIYARDGGSEEVEFELERRRGKSTVTLFRPARDQRPRKVLYSSRNAPEEAEEVATMLRTFDIWAMNATDAAGAACRTEHGYRRCYPTFNDYSVVMRVESGKDVRVQRYTGLEKRPSSEVRALGDYLLAWARKREERGGRR